MDLTTAALQWMVTAPAWQFLAMMALMILVALRTFLKGALAENI